MKIDREAVKTLAIAIGVREAARQLGLNEDRVRQWSKREKWLQHEPKPQPPTVTKNLVTTVTKPSDALQSILADDSKQTKIGFSRAARKVAKHLEEAPVKELVTPQKAIAAKSWHGIAESVHGWKVEERGSGVLPGLNVYSQQTIVQVSQTLDDK